MPAFCPHRISWHIAGFSNQGLCLSCLSLGHSESCDIPLGPAPRWSHSSSCALSSGGDCNLPGQPPSDLTILPGAWPQGRLGHNTDPTPSWCTLVLFTHRWKCDICLGQAHRCNDDCHTSKRSIGEITLLLAWHRKTRKVLGLLLYKSHRE